MQVLTGLRADNLLGFLAALGVCRLTACGLSWTKIGPVEFAALDTVRSLDDLTDELLTKCRQPLVVERCSHPNLVLEPEEWAALPDEWAAAVACQTAAKLARSPLLTCGSAGRQVVTVMRELSKVVDATDIRGALAGPWVYHERFGMQWDPTEYRVAGERWMRPTKEKSRVAWGPTRLALDGLPLWPILTPRYAPFVRYVTWREPLTAQAVRGRILSGIGDRIFECDRIAGDKGRVSFDAVRAVA